MEVIQQLVPILLMGITVQILGWRPFTVQYLNESYEIYHPEIINLSSTIKNGSYLDAKVVILREISQLYADFEALIDSGNGTFDLVLMNRTVNVCMFLNNRKLNPIFAILFQMLADHVDLPRRCPLRKRRYEVVNLFLDPEKLPPFMADHKAKLLAEVWTRVNGKKENLIKLTLNVIVERSYKRTASS